MSNLNKIIDFMLFRFSFEITTELNQELIREKLYESFNQDQSFLYPVYEMNKFAFSHKNFLPGFYDFSPIIFEGEISKKAGTSISVSAKTYPLLIWFFVIGISSILISYFTNFDGMRDEFSNSQFPFNPLFSPIIMLLPYGYYAFKINDVRGILRGIVCREEKLTTTDKT